MDGTQADGGGGNHHFINGVSLVKLFVKFKTSLVCTLCDLFRGVGGGGGAIMQIQ